MSDAPVQHEQDKLNGPSLTEGGDIEGSVGAEAAPPALSIDETTVGAMARTSGKEASHGSQEIAQTEGTASADGVHQQEAQSQPEATIAVEPEPSNANVAGERNDVEEKKEAAVSATGTVDELQTPADPSAAAPSPSLTHTSLRPLSPSSRTSTPPLSGTIAPTAKKFSAMNVNKKFLSKTGTTPSPSNASSTAKLNSLSSRPATSPVPIAAPSSRLLSTKLTTVSSSKPSVSPQPPSSASTSSPWAKPSLPSTDGGSTMTSLHSLSANGKPKMPSAPMGQGQGLGSARPAWRAVNADGKRPAVGMSRDFPTAREVAEGKRAAESAAQAQAAQAAAILQNLEEEFTHLRDSAHRWDDDDDEDGIIDFGGDLAVLPPAPPRPQVVQPVPRPDVPLDQPVSKSERFVEDFDRSWPRSARQAAEEVQRPPDLRKRESDRVLFNASSNRLEPPSSRPQPPQPTRLMSRNEVPAAPAPSLSSATGRDGLRQPPPHMAQPAPGASRQLPPHMADVAPTRPQQAPNQPLARSAWSTTARDVERPLPPHMANKPELPQQASAFETSRSPPTGPGSALPSRRSFGQGTQPTVIQTTSPQQPTHPTPAVDLTDSQAAEMHSAAEKARLRREAEEKERLAAAERAKQKARELEARLGLKTAARSTAPATESAAPAPPPIASTPSYTIAQRPKPPAGTVPAVPHVAPADSSHAPVRPSTQPMRSRDDQWRSRDAVPQQSAPAVNAAVEPAVQPRSIAVRNRSTRPTAESFFERQPNATQPPPVASVDSIEAGPSTRQPTDAEVQALFDEAVGEQSSKKDFMFDDTLARIKAAMGGPKVGQPNAAAAEGLAPPSDSRRRTSDTLPSKSASQPQATKAAPPAPRPVIPEFFDVTQPEIPRSPPPAWRTYTVKVPKQSTQMPDIPQSQFSALRRIRQPARGWLMSFNPPLDLPQYSLSRTEMFLPAPGPRRVARTETTPLVSISQRNLEPFVKEGKSRDSSGPARQADYTPVASASGVATGQSRSSGRWRAAEEPAPSAPEPVATQVAVDLLDAPPVQPKPTARPVVPMAQPQAAPKADVAARFETSGLGAMANGSSTTDTADPADPADPKSGVRFMVSSELEGDSLLDEVNKMSLETVEEAGMKDGPKASGAEIMPPRSPVSHGGPSAPRTHPSSPNGNVTWNTSHEHLKHVWQQTPPHGGEAQTVSAPSTLPEPSATPLFPSLNAPSATDPPAPQSAATKLSYPSSQTFSPTSATFSSLRQQSPGVGYSSPTSADGMSGLGYPRSQAGVNGYAGMSQQNLWSAPFSTPTTGYSAGYASSKAGMDPKAAMAFNGAGAGSQYLYGQTGGYSSLPTAHSPYGQYSSHQAQAQHQHPSRMAASPNGAYNYPANYSPAQAQVNRMSRFGQQPNGAGAASSADYDNGGYYGYVGASGGAGGGQAAQPNQNHGMYYTSSGTAAVGHGTMQQRGGQGAGRKMW